MFSPQMKSSEIHLYYRIRNNKINNLVKEASQRFEIFTEKNSTYALQQSIALFAQAVDMSGYSDRAFCLRKYASAIVRDIDNPNRYNEAKKHLDQAISIFNIAIANTKNPDHSEILEIEKQRTLNQLIKCAYELRDGPLLEKSAKELFDTTRGTRDNFFIDACQALFHLAFAKQDYKNARAYLSEIEGVISKKDSKFLTHRRHVDKIMLAEIYLAYNSKSLDTTIIKAEFAKLEECFSKTLDARKSLFKQKRIKQKNPTAVSCQLVKDFNFLFHLRVCKRLMKLDDEIESAVTNPKEYVLALAKEVFNEKNFQ